MRGIIESDKLAVTSGNQERFVPKIYYFDPLQAGPRNSWAAHLQRCRNLGFDYLLSAPIFDPGVPGDPFLTENYERANSAIDPNLSADDFVKEFAAECREHDLELLLDVAVGHAAVNAEIVQHRPQWFRKPPKGRLDPRASRRDENVALFDLSDETNAKDIIEWWSERLGRLAKAGVSGFRCLDMQAVPPSGWLEIITKTNEQNRNSKFLAWTPGLDWKFVAALRHSGFSAAFSSIAWWDGRGNWLAEEHELLCRIGSVIGCPEVPFGERLSKGLSAAACNPNQFRYLLKRAAAISDGLMIPMGVELGASTDGARKDANDLKIKPDWRSDAIQETNALTDEIAGLAVGREMRILAGTGPATAIFRSGYSETRKEQRDTVVLINSDLSSECALPFSIDPLPPSAGKALTIDRVISSDRDSNAKLAPGEVRVIGYQKSPPIKLRRTEAQAMKMATLPRIVIDNVSPSVEEGRFPAKRIVGETVAIEADVFTDGHELLAVEVLWRAGDEKDWRQEIMKPAGNDRWGAEIRPNRIGRYEFTIAVWWNRYGSFCRDLEIKQTAGVDLSVELLEGRDLLQNALGRTEDDERQIISAALGWLDDASEEQSAAIFLAHDLREVMYDAEERQFFIRREPTFALEVERPRAAFAAWYEMFPRSATDSPKRHGTFNDVIKRLPAIRDMGFDVLYMPPIHPIGVTNRKGKNNSLTTEPGDVGSPYAIGAVEGGHDAIHPDLGDIADFRRLRDAAANYGIEIALDFAIQCSPDHPWLKTHPEWFRWRPDGSVRYAENPPKKYQDIVNVDFYAPKAFPSLWHALRDIVLYWREEGVRLFRVDNPHTKPLPFWEWLISQVRGKYPDVVFLAEAFTTPKVMYRLAMAGFSQSYTYFTWRNSKQDLTEYFTELATTDVKDFFRPHLFVNTPDINPYFLQTSGRPGFLIRAALAATLSGLWGMYSGFELCEAAALPGREEYLDSEKYEIRVRRFDEPGNIVDEITKLNRIRRNHPALHSHLGVRFYPAHHDQILLYGKMSAEHDGMILVAVNLNPFHGHEATIEVPLWEWELPDNASVHVRDLMRDESYTWHGKLQRVRLDLALPFAIWHVQPDLGG